jgi:hypothetical protein
VPTSRSTVRGLDVVYINEDPAPGTLLGPRGGSTFKLRGQSGKRLWAYMSTGFGVGFMPPGAKYDQVTLGIRAVSEWVGPTQRDIYVRPIIAPWNINAIHWGNKPQTTSAYQAVRRRTDFPNKALWQFDVTAMLNGFAGPCYGFEIILLSEDSQERSFHGNGGEVKYRPYMDVQWSIPPNQPQTLNPGEGRSVSGGHPVLSCDFSDYTGNNNFRAIRVQINPTDNFSAPAWDSGEVISPGPFIDLSKTNYPGIPDESEAWWRVAVQDTDMHWSAWSASTQFERHTKGVVTITNPAAAPNNIINNPRPQIRWTFAGRTQRQFEVTVTDQNNAIVHYSTRVTSPLSQYTLPPNVIRELTAKYKVNVKVFDDYDRANVVGDSAWVEAEQEFTFDKDATAAPVTNLTAVKDPLGRPWVTFKWKRGTVPSYFSLAEGNTILKGSIDPADVFVSGTDYEYTYRGVAPRKNHTYSILAQQGELLSGNNPTVTVNVKPVTGYLCSDDGQFSIPLLNPENGLTLADDSAVYTVLNASESTAVYGEKRGFEGSFGGILSNAEGGRTSAQYLDDFLGVREQDGIPMWLSYLDQMVFCVVRNLNYKPVRAQEEIMYAVTFDVLEKVVGK